MQKNTIILLNKKEDITSFQCLSPLKNVVCKKAGHAGTLDKFATGLIISFTGKYTKLNPIFMALDKVYEAEVCFGKETTTLDPEGPVIKEGRIPTISEIKAALKGFKGLIEQAPPAFSSIHIDGKRAYTLAREGKEVEMKKRPVTVYDYEIMSYNEPILKIKIKVSKGFYVRSFARDLAYALGSAGYLTALERTAIGPFKVEEAVFYDDKEALAERAESFDLIKITDKLSSFKQIELTKEEAAKFYFGHLPDLEPYLALKEKYLIFFEGGKVLAIVDKNENKTICQVVAK